MRCSQCSPRVRSSLGRTSAFAHAKGEAGYARYVAWRFEHSAESNADPHAVWQRYLDVEHWCDWSRHGVEWSRIDGPFAVGTKGKSKPPGSRALAFRLVAVEPVSTNTRTFETDPAEAVVVLNAVAVPARLATAFA